VEMMAQQVPQDQQAQQGTRELGEAQDKLGLQALLARKEIQELTRMSQDQLDHRAQEVILGHQVEPAILALRGHKETQEQTQTLQDPLVLKEQLAQLGQVAQTEMMAQLVLQAQLDPPAILVQAEAQDRLA